MPRLPHIVLADDLTGAAEIAAIAHQAGLRALVLTALPAAPIQADVLVFDTNTRLASRPEAARRIRSVVARLTKIRHAGFFMKVDSVLRGPVLPQLAACARVLGRQRILLVAANPSLGRVIRHGRYMIDGQPLHQTAFARDPHHPRKTDEVIKLLGQARPAPVVCPASSRRLPRTGVLIGEAATANDIVAWADRLDRSTLPAGGADFFRAWLKTQTITRRAVSRYSLPTGGTLLLHGTTVAALNARALVFDGRRPPSTRAVIAALQVHGAVAVAASPTTLHDPGAPAAISLGFARLARNLHEAGAFRHLLIAGGATAATVLRALGWTSFKAIRVWGSGVVTLQPTAAPEFAVTVKPGSYPWPDKLRPMLLDFILS
jgi:D-threonate/D-erythronate kinase